MAIPVLEHETTIDGQSSRKLHAVWELDDYEPDWARSFDTLLGRDGHEEVLPPVGIGQTLLLCFPSWEGASQVY